MTDESDSESQSGTPKSAPGGPDAGELQSLETDSAKLRSELAERRRLRLGSLFAALGGIIVSIASSLLALKSLAGSSLGSNQLLIFGISALAAVLGGATTSLFDRAERAVEPKLAHLAADDIWGEVWKKNSAGRGSPI